MLFSLRVLSTKISNSWVWVSFRESVIHTLLLLYQYFFSHISSTICAGSV
ncbi:hypothetical protein JCM19298_3016 [Nonlabens ulvanivorans]|nr:hypothetical protein JCM19298_3016 [Nonlabens ulvanivorans]